MQFPICKTVSADQICKDSRFRSTRVQPLVWKAVTQNAPDT